MPGRNDVNFSTIRARIVRKATASSDMVLAVFVLASVAAMIVRLPAAALDMLIAVNLAFAIAIMLVALYVDTASKLTSLPSLLLISTLFRLSISVSTTRLVLLDGHAGRIVEAFGRVVAGGNVLVGGVVFLVLTLVQFIVVAKGAERVAEVAARFTLDAMPGKQMSIDADLRAGSSTLEEAQRRRGELERESQLYGALDGAMKFVKGDAVAGLVIAVVNIAGGLAVGVLQRGMSIGAAAAHYTVLTIGDGLVSQIPALLISTTAGLVVTRVPGPSAERGLAGDIAEQTTEKPRPLAIAAVMLGIVAILPGLPALPFLALAGAAGVGAWSKRGRREHAGPPARRAPGDADRALVLANAAPVRVFLPLVVEVEEDHWESAVAGLRLRLWSELGLRVPEIERIPSPSPTEWAIEIAGVRARTGTSPAAACWAFAAADEVAALGLAGPVVAAGGGGTYVWGTALGAGLAASAGYETGGHAELVHRELEHALREHAAEFVGVQEARELADSLEATHPALVQEVVPRLLSYAQVADVLRRLAREGVSIRDLRAIFEALAAAAPYDREPSTLAEAARGALRRQISEGATRGRETLGAYVLSPEVDAAFRIAIASHPGLDAAPVDPTVIGLLLDGVRECQAVPRRSGVPPAPIVVAGELRRAVRAVTELAWPELPVLAYGELMPTVRIQPVGVLGAAA